MQIRRRINLTRMSRMWYKRNRIIILCVPRAIKMTKWNGQTTQYQRNEFQSLGICSREKSVFVACARQIFIVIVSSFMYLCNTRVTTQSTNDIRFDEDGKNNNKKKPFVARASQSITTQREAERETENGEIQSTSTCGVFCLFNRQWHQYHSYACNVAEQHECIKNAAILDFWLKKNRSEISINFSCENRMLRLVFDLIRIFLVGLPRNVCVAWKPAINILISSRSSQSNEISGIWYELTHWNVS